MIVRNVPANMFAVRRFSDLDFGGRRVDGVIGTVLLYHFLSTIDYPGGALVLRRRTLENLRAFEQAPHTSYVMPFWMAGDHYIVAWGKINQCEPMLFFLDTGLVGGGWVREIPFPIQTLSLGEITQHDTHGIYMGPFPLEYACGFRIGGLISHEFFRPWALTFDFTSMRCFLTASG
jgi:hypothetical protein